MGMHAKIPPQFEARAERRVWFDRQDAERLLDWIEDSGAAVAISCAITMARAACSNPSGKEPPNERSCPKSCQEL